MKKYEVVLTKSYIVIIKAEDKNKAKEYSELFTGDIQDISSIENKRKFNFEIEDIDCKFNEVFEVQEELA
jgi:predicted small secreted protein